MKKRIFVVVLVFSFLLSACTGKRTVEFESDRELVTASSEEENTEKTEEVEPSQEMETEAAVSENETEESTLFIDLSGEVNEPGVYELPVGNRVFHAIVAAGGFTDQAETRCVNQADALVDGEKIYIYSREEAAEAGGWMYLSGRGLTPNSIPAESGNVGGETGVDARVNINRADLGQLMTITGIGEARAEAILSYRENNGAFSAVEDIMKVSGIKEKLFEQIKDKITV